MRALLACAVGLAFPSPCRAAEPPQATVEVRAPADALIYVDERYLGTAPMEVTLPVGAHEVGVYARGHEPYLDRRRIAPGAHVVDVTLQPTGQRIAALVAVSVGLAALAAGVGLGAASIALPEEQPGAPPPSPSANEMRTAAALAGGLGALTFSVGGLLYLFDAPPLPDAPRTASSLGPTGLTWTARF